MQGRGGYKEVLQLAFPAVISTLSYSVMCMTDTIMVGRIGATEIAAIGLANIIIFTILAFFIGALESIETFVSQDFGAGRMHLCARMGWYGVSLSVVSGLVILIFIPLSPLLFEIFGSSKSVRVLGEGYFNIRILGGMFFLISFALGRFFVGVQDTKINMWISLVANAVNIVLDYGLIFGALGFPNYGTEGAAIATVAASFVSVVLYFVFFLDRKYQDLFGTRVIAWPQYSEIARILKIGLPIGVEVFLRMGAFLLFSAVIGRAGDIELAASQICLQIIRFSFMPGYGLSVATCVLVGKYIGAVDLESAERILRSSLVIGLVYACVLAVLFLAYTNEMIAVFTTDTVVIDTCHRIMFLAVLLQLFDIVSTVAAGALRGAGDTTWLMKVTVSVSWFVGLPLAVFFCLFVHLGAFGAWIGLTTEIAFLALVIFMRFKGGTWKAIKI
ncbi:MAG: MATE family efflux transporter [Deltaproteobacteria bacterium]|nr:MATE family efflux transporter [Deltaproteobacteria bacterium]